MYGNKKIKLVLCDYMQWCNPHIEYDSLYKKDCSFEEHKCLGELNSHNKSYEAESVLKIIGNSLFLFVIPRSPHHTHTQTHSFCKIREKTQIIYLFSEMIKLGSNAIRFVVHTWFNIQEQFKWKSFCKLILGFSVHLYLDYQFTIQTIKQKLIVAIEWEWVCFFFVYFDKRNTKHERKVDKIGHDEESETRLFSIFMHYSEIPAKPIQTTIDSKTKSCVLLAKRS